MWQPLVENATRHGIALREAPGKLTLTVRRRSGTLLLIINADGPTATKSAACSQPEFEG